MMERAAELELIAQYLVDRKVTVCPPAFVAPSVQSARYSEFEVPHSAVNKRGEWYKKSRKKGLQRVNRRKTVSPL